jgi:orotate phosphoribosyltransferase
MTEQEILNVLHRLDAVFTGGHYVYTSGKHGEAYVNKDAVYPHTLETSLLCRNIARAFLVDKVEAVVGPTLGGVILSQWVSHHLRELTAHRVFAVYAEKTGEGFVVSRGYDSFLSGRRVLVVEDILNTGGSARKVVEAVKAVGGLPVGVGALCNRGGVTAAGLGVEKLVSLTNIPLKAWDEKSCPLCRNNIPINTNVGKGREFLARKDRK